MNKLDKAISTAKKLIDLPYNKFSLENYSKILTKHFGSLDFIRNPNLPCQLMSGNHSQAGIVKTPGKGKIYLVGKGILFDSGGLDLKRGMADMSDDKAGMIIALTVANYFKKDVIAYCPVTTNFLQTSKITPGDEIKIGKKIVKVTNTDAEGRLILAEALDTLHPNKNDIVITIATLTGAVGYAIGEEATGVFAENETLLAKYAGASFETEELAWGLPLWAHYQKKYYNKKVIENSIRDIKCGATEGALFVKQFVAYPENWIHLDIASSSFDKDGKANGVPIKSLINFIKKVQ
jgi:leucyl aminopeptidase